MPSLTVDIPIGTQRILVNEARQRKLSLDAYVRDILLRRATRLATVDAHPKTHCRKGHPMVPGNTSIIARDGWRRCLECHRIASRNAYKRKHPFVIPYKEKP